LFPDRLGRSLQDLVGFLTELRALGCHLYLHQQALDTSTPAGRAMFQMRGVFAEFERGIIRERVNAGLARARANGVKLGRRRVKPSVEAQILALRDMGYGILRIGKQLGIGTSVVQRVFQETPWKRQSARRPSVSGASRTTSARCRLIALLPKIPHSSLTPFQAQSLGASLISRVSPTTRQTSQGR
jgi:DNA invertase Pin-like site-specific DNA recombinase